MRTPGWITGHLPKPVRQFRAESATKRCATMERHRNEKATADFGLPECLPNGSDPGAPIPAWLRVDDLDGAARALVADEFAEGAGEPEGRLVKHARYYRLLLAESHLTRRLFGSMV